MLQQIKRVKQSTVRVLVNGKPAGSGFVVREDGLIATCFHVVAMIQTSGNQPTAGFQQNISVDLPSVGTLPAAVHQICQDQAVFLNAVAKDFALLQVSAASLPALPLGSLADATEGDDVYLCGHPIGIEQAVVARGMLSTKWSASDALGQPGTRNAAWIDITQNCGNSGGPVLVRGSDPLQDVVIGLATFGLAPYAHEVKALVEFAKTMQNPAPGIQVSVSTSGLNVAGFAGLVGRTLAANSIGVSGCVSAEYLATALAALP